MILPLIAALAFLSSPAHAEKKAEIFCKSKTVFADAGAIVEIAKQSDGGYQLTYTKNSIGGPRVAAQFAVTVEATKPGKSGCELDITKSADGSHRFFVKQHEGAKWNMVLPKTQKEGEMKCEVKEALREQLCQAGNTSANEQDLSGSSEAN